MSCDIHTYLEVKKKVKGEERWVSADIYKKNEYYNIYNDETEEYYVVNVYNDRDYTAFGILANVRNYDNNETISEPKGIPEDTCKEIIKEYRKWGRDGHSHSYFTLRELLDYQEEHKKIPIKYSGLVDEEGLKKIEKGEFPDMWWSSSTDKSLVYTEWEMKVDKLEKIINNIKEHLLRIREFYSEENLLANADNIRLVFWFDN